MTAVPFRPGAPGTHGEAELGPLLSRIGNTPLVRLRRVTEGLVPEGVEVWVKCEWFNPGGSIKDRAALAMVLDAERRGLLQPGGERRILDASSGNTGIAYALIAAARGYGLTLCLPANASAERKQLLRAYGAEVVETSAMDGSDGAILEARKLAAAEPDRYAYLDQYSNPANWQAHFRTTGPELWRDTEGRLTHFVSALGTSGTFTGTARFLKAQDPGVQVVSLQPDSPYHALEGWKHMETALVPSIYDPGLADAALEIPSEEALALTRRLALEEGLLTGPSGGGAVWGALEVARQLEEGVVVTVLADSGDRYLSHSHVFGG